jgi:hypothetical protein
MNHYKELNFTFVAVSDIWKNEGKMEPPSGKRRWGTI